MRVKRCSSSCRGRLVRGPPTRRDVPVPSDCSVWRLFMSSLSLSCCSWCNKPSCSGVLPRQTHNRWMLSTLMDAPRSARSMVDSESSAKSASCCWFHPRCNRAVRNNMFVIDNAFHQASDYASSSYHDIYTSSMSIMYFE